MFPFVGLSISLLLVLSLAYDLTRSWRTYRSTSQRRRGLLPFLSWWFKNKRYRRRTHREGEHQHAATGQTSRHSSRSRSQGPHRSDWGYLARWWRKIPVTSKLVFAAIVDIVAIILLLLYSDTMPVTTFVSFAMALVLVFGIILGVAVWRERQKSRERAPLKSNLVRRWRRWSLPTRFGVAVGLVTVVILIGFLVSRMTIFRKSNSADFMASAKGYVQEKRYREALIELRNAVQKEPKNVEANRALARMLFLMGQSEEALQYCQDAAQRDPESYDAQLELASMALKSNRIDVAVAAAEKAVALKPDEINSRLVLAQAYVGDRNIPLAVAAAEKAVAMKPDDAQARLVLAQAYLGGGKITLAVEQCRTVLARQPAHGGARKFLIDIYQQSRSYGDLLREADAWLKVSPGSTDLKVTRAQALVGLGRIDAAMETLRAAGEEDQKALRPYEYLAALQSRTGDYAGAMKTYEELLRRNPDQPLIKNDLADLIANHGTNLERAYTLASELHKSLPDNPATNDTLGWVLYRQGKAKESLDHLRRAAQGLPREPVVRYHLGAALLKSGDRSAGRKELEEALSLARNFPGADEARAIQRSAGGKGEK